MARTPLETARAWLDAVNAGDAERVLEASDAEIEIVGPRGSGFGHAPLRQWMSHARVTLDALRAFARGDAVVVEQHGTWRDPATGALADEARVSSRFVIRDGRVALYARHGALDDALAAAGLTSGDEV